MCTLNINKFTIYNFLPTNSDADFCTQQQKYTNKNASTVSDGKDGPGSH